jgi:hypothetical protein
VTVPLSVSRKEGEAEALSTYIQGTNPGKVLYLQIDTKGLTIFLCGHQWRLVAKISGVAAPENCIFFIHWGMATDIKLKDYIFYKEKRTHYITCYR